MARIFGFICRGNRKPGRPLINVALPMLLAALSGCAAFTPPSDTGGPAVASHLGYVKDFMEAGDQERARMVGELENPPDADTPRTRLRYAIVLSLRDGGSESLARSLALLDELHEADGLSPAERWLARLWQSEVASRLELARENTDYRAALEQAREKLDQLTRIEQQLEAQDNNSEEQ